MRPRVLGLGNELLGDDAIGIIAARRIGLELADQVEVVEASTYGLALLDVILGCRQLIIIDAIKTGSCPVGTLIQLDPETLDRVVAPSPHYSGIPEIRALARALHLDFPDQLTILAVEIADAECFGAPLSEPVRSAIDEVVIRVETQLAQWRNSTVSSPDYFFQTNADRMAPRWRKVENFNS